MNNQTFTHAIVRIPASNFAEGLTTADLGRPDLEKTLKEHAEYCSALHLCGVKLTVLDPDPRYPDSTFVEDVAVLTSHSAILTNPGADSRKGEVTAIRETIAHYFHKIYTVSPPGTLDGGDICEAGSHFFIGLSERTNIEGGRQLADFLAQEGYTSSFIQVKGVPGILHLKSGVAYLGDDRLVLIDAFAALPDFKKYQVVRVRPEENYAANCLRVNNQILLPEGFPRLRESIQGLGYPVIPLNMSEFQKMDGGLSCLSLRF